MPLTCGCESFDYYDHYYIATDYTQYTLKRSRKCISCGDRIKTGDTAFLFRHFRKTKNDIEERIYGDDEDGHVPLADKYACEVCGDLFLSLDELGFCTELGENYKELVKEYAEMQKGDIYD